MYFYMNSLFQYEYNVSRFLMIVNNKVEPFLYFPEIKEKDVRIKDVRIKDQQ